MLSKYAVQHTNFKHDSDEKITYFVNYTERGKKFQQLLHCCVYKNYIYIIYML